MTEFNLKQPGMSRIAGGLFMWFIIIAGTFITRLPMHYSVNLTILTVIIPLMIWYLGNTSLLISMTGVSVVMTLVIAILSLVTVTEGIKWQKLKQGYEKLGRAGAEEAWLPTVATMLALIFGLIVTHLLTSGRVLDMY